MSLGQEDKDRIEAAIFSAIDDINQQLPRQDRLGKRLDVNLFGPAGTLDSLGMVSLIVATEKRLEEVLGFAVNVADPKAMSQKGNPFQTVGTFAEHISFILTEKRNAASKI